MFKIIRYMAYLCICLCGWGAMAADLPVEVQKGLAWLQMQKNADGAIKPTAIVFSTQAQAYSELANTEKSFLPTVDAKLLAKTMSILDTSVNEDLSRKYRLQKEVATANALKDWHRFNGGTAIQKEGYEPNLYDTAYNIESLVFYGAVDAPAIAPSLVWLTGKLLGVSADNAVPSFDVLQGLLALNKAASLIPVANAPAAQQNALVFLNAQEEQIKTSPILLALYVQSLSGITGQKDKIQAMAGFLKQQQKANGSWSDDVYTTALALRALASASQPEPTVPSTGALQGRVLDAASGLPIEGVLVRLSSSIQATTNAQGMYVVSNLATGAYSIAYSKSAYASQTLTNIQVSAPKVLTIGDVKLEKQSYSVTVEGYVKTIQKQPISDALVSVGGRNTKTDAQGWYRLMGVDIGPIMIKVTRAGYQEVTVKAETQTPTVIAFSPTLYGINEQKPSQISVVGKVQDKTGAAIEGATLEVNGKQVLSNAQGDFALDLPNMVAGTYTFAVSKPGLQTMAGNATLVLGVNNFGVLTLQPAVTPIYKINGTVTDQNTKAPIANAKVELALLGLAVQTNAEGKFTLDGLSVSQVQVEVSAVGYQKIVKSLALQSMMTELSVQLLPETPETPGEAGSIQIKSFKTEYPSYSANDELEFIVEAQNTFTSAKDLHFAVTVKNSLGQFAFTVHDKPHLGNLDTLYYRALPAGEVTEVEMEKYLNQQPAGVYDATLAIMSPEGRVLAEAKTQFTIKAEQIASGTLVLNPPIAHAGQNTPIDISAVLSNVGNTAIINPTVTVKVTVDETGQQVQKDELAVKTEMSFDGTRSALSLDKNDIPYVIDNQNGKIYQWVGGEERLYASLDRATTIQHMTFDPAGNLLAIDAYGYVYVIKPDASFNKVKLVTPFYNIMGITAKAEGQWYITGRTNTSEHVLVYRDKQGQETIVYKNGLAKPYDMVKDAANNLIVSNMVDGTISKVLVPSGKIELLYSGLNQPKGLAYHPNGDLYVVNSGDGSLVRISPQGVKSVLTTGFNAPEDVTVSSSGVVYVSSPGDRALYKVAANGVKTIVKQSFGVEQIIDLFYDASGVLYSLDSSGTVYKKMADNQITQVAKVGSYATAIAQLDVQTLLVANQYGEVKKVSLSTGEVTPFMDRLPFALTDILVGDDQKVYITSNTNRVWVYSNTGNPLPPDLYSPLSDPAMAIDDLNGKQLIVNAFVGYDGYRILTQVNKDGSFTATTVPATHLHPYSTALAPTGTAGQFYGQGPDGKIYRIDGVNPPVLVTDSPRYLVGLGLDVNKKLLILNRNTQGKYELLVADPATGALSKLYDLPADMYFYGPQGVSFDNRGTLYFQTNSFSVSKMDLATGVVSAAYTDSTIRITRLSASAAGVAVIADGNKKAFFIPKNGGVTQDLSSVYADYKMGDVRAMVQFGTGEWLFVAPNYYVLRNVANVSKTVHGFNASQALAKEGGKIYLTTTYGGLYQYTPQGAVLLASGFPAKRFEKINADFIGANQGLISTNPALAGKIAGYVGSVAKFNNKMAFAYGGGYVDEFTLDFTRTASIPSLGAVRGIKTDAAGLLYFALYAASRSTLGGGIYTLNPNNPAIPERKLSASYPIEIASVAAGNVDFIADQGTQIFRNQSKLFESPARIYAYVELGSKAYLLDYEKSTILQLPTGAAKAEPFAMGLNTPIVPRYMAKTGEVYIGSQTTAGIVAYADGKISLKHSFEDAPLYAYALTNQEGDALYALTNNTFFEKTLAKTTVSPLASTLGSGVQSLQYAQSKQTLYALQSDPYSAKTNLLSIVTKKAAPVLPKGTVVYSKTLTIPSLPVDDSKQRVNLGQWLPAQSGDYQVSLSFNTPIKGQLTNTIHIGDHAEARLGLSQSVLPPGDQTTALHLNLKGGDFSHVAQVDLSRVSFTGAKTSRPNGYTADKAGNIFYLKGGDTAIYKVDALNQVETVFAKLPEAIIAGVVIDSQENLYALTGYISGLSSKKLYKVNKKGEHSVVQTLDAGAYPKLAIDSKDNWVVAYDGHVLRPAPDNKISTQKVPGMGGGRGIALDGNDNLYYTDWSKIVGKVSPAGELSPIFYKGDGEEHPRFESEGMPLAADCGSNIYLSPLYWSKVGQAGEEYTLAQYNTQTGKVAAIFDGRAIHSDLTDMDDIVYDRLGSRVLIWTDYSGGRIWQVPVDCGSIGVEAHLISHKDQPLTGFSTAPHSEQNLPDGRVEYIWSFQGVNATTGLDIQFAGLMKDLKLGESRPSVSEAFVVFNNSFTAQPLKVPVAIPDVNVASVYDIAVKTDKPSYPASTKIDISVPLFNRGVNAATLTLDLELQDAMGQKMQGFAARQVTLQPSHATAQTYLSNSEKMLVGNYRLVATLRDAQGAVVGKAEGDFEITDGGIKVGSTLKTDKASYTSNQMVRLVSQIKNLSDNRIVEDTHIKLKVMDATGKVIFTDEKVWLTLARSASADTEASFTLKNASAGTYKVEQTILDDGGTVLDTQSTTFKVLSVQDSAAGLKGTLNASPATVQAEDSITLAAQLQNDGNADLSNLPVVVRVLDVANNKVVAEYPYQATLKPQIKQAKSHIWKTPAVNQKSAYIAALVATVGGKEFTLAQQPLEVTPVEAKLQVSTTQTQLPIRLLGLVSCRAQEQGTDKNAATACLADKKAKLGGVFAKVGIAADIATTQADFEQKLRSQRYQVFWLSGGAQKLGSTLPAELLEAVYRGGGLMIEGERDNRTAQLDTALGVSYTGVSLAYASQVDVQSSILGARSLPLTGNKYVFNAIGASVEGKFPRSTLSQINKANKGGAGFCDVATSLREAPAVFANSYGDGYMTLLAFDGLSAMQTASAQAAWGDMLKKWHARAALNVQNNSTWLAGYAQLNTRVSNIGNNAVTYKLTLPLQGGVRVVQASPAALLTPTAATWQQTLAAGASGLISYELGLPNTGNPVSIPYSLSLVKAGQADRVYGQYTATVPVLGFDRLANVLVDLQAQIATLSAADKIAAQNALTQLQQAQTHISAKTYDKALQSLLNTSALLHPIANSNVQKQRKIVSDLIAATQAQLAFNASAQ